MIKKRIALIDDHVIVRNGLKSLIEKLGDYSVVFEADNGQQVLDAWPLEPLPDLIVMDISMPVLDGIETMQQLTTLGCNIPVLILTLNEDEHGIIKLFRLGIRGYLTKNISAAEMKQALEDVFRTGYYHNHFLSFTLKNQGLANSKTEQDKVLLQLTAREKEFLKLVCHENEYTYGQVADLMNVHVRTVDGYRESVFDKFGIKSKTGLVLFVIKHRLIDHL